MTDQNTLPAVSIIIPAYNEEKVIGACLDSIAKLDYPDDLLDVIVIDDGSTDRTAEIISGYRSVKVIKGIHKGPSAARNLALKQAKGDYVAFTDADCVVSSEWIKRLLKGFISDKVAGVGGIQVPAKGESEFAVAVNRVLGAFGFIAGYSRVNKTSTNVDHNASCNVIYKKHVIEQVGGFDEALWPGEDVDLDRKMIMAGYTLRQDPGVSVEHYRPSTMSQYRNMMYKYGLVQAYLVKKYGIFRAIQVIPFASMLTVLAAILIIILFKLTGLLMVMILACLIFLLFNILRGLTVPQDNLLVLVTLYEWHRGFYSYFFGFRKVM